MSKEQTTTLLVDGEYLKKKIEEAGDEHCIQTVRMYLYRVIEAIEKAYPEAKLKIHYFGAKAVSGINRPISGQPYQEQDVRARLRQKSELFGTPFESDWGRNQRYIDRPWIMKPSAYGKKAEELTDTDFELAVENKGVQTKLVDKMAELAISKQNDRIMVLGDEKDLKYSLEMTRGLDSVVDVIDFEQDKPRIKSFGAYCVSPIFDKNIFDEVFCLIDRQKEATSQIKQSKEVNAQTDALSTKDIDTTSLMESVRGAFAADNKGDESFLFVDGGALRSMLFNKNFAFTKENVAKVLKNIEKKAGGKFTHTVMYWTDVSDKQIVNPKIPKHEKSELNIEDLTGLDVIFSNGMVHQSKDLPNILNKKKWFVPHDRRDRMDFEANIKQMDVDDRIAYDLALARFYPPVGKVYLLSMDSDFVVPVKKAKRAGLEICLVKTADEERLGLSPQLKGVSGQLLDIDFDKMGLDTMAVEEQNQHIENENEKKERLNRQKKQKKIAARLEAEDEDDFGAEFWQDKKQTKEERWRAARAVIRAKNRKKTFDLARDKARRLYGKRKDR